MDDLPARIKDVVAELRRELQDLYGERFRDLLLYGSDARGEADEGSDVDLLLLLEGPVNPVKEIVRMESVTWPLSLDSELLLSVMPVNFQDFQKSRTAFLSTVRKEAIQAA